MADLTPGEKAALCLTLGEKIIELVKETGLLKPKRRKSVVRRKRTAKTNGAAAPKRERKPKAKEPKAAPLPVAPVADEDDE